MSHLAYVLASWAIPSWVWAAIFDDVPLPACVAPYVFGLLMEVRWNQIEEKRSITR